MTIPPETEARGPAVLQGWKDIATYLGRSVRAVQRWERELGLPIRRIRTADGQTVYAERADLDEWKKSRDPINAPPEPGDEEIQAGDELEGGETAPPPEPAHRQRSVRPFLLFGAVMLVLGVAAGYVMRPIAVGPVSSIQVTGTAVSAFDPKERLVWRVEMGAQVELAQAGHEPNASIDLMSLGPQSVYVVPIRFGTPHKLTPRSDVLVGFTPQGQILWKFQPDVSVTCGNERVTAPWRISTIVVSSDEADPKVWVAFNHHTWWPSMLYEIRPNGTVSLRYFQNGWILGFAEWPGKSARFLAVNGVSNEKKRASTAIIDLDSPPAASPSSDPAFDCSDVPAARPAALFLWPALDVLGPEAYGMATEARPVGGGVQVLLNQGGGGAIVQMDSLESAKSLRLTDQYWVMHRQRESEGWIKHDVESCPERTRHQEFERWTSKDGWTTHSIIPAIASTSSRSKAAR